MFCEFSVVKSYHNVVIAYKYMQFYMHIYHMADVAATKLMKIGDSCCFHC